MIKFKTTVFLFIASLNESTPLTTTTTKDHTHKKGIVRWLMKSIFKKSESTDTISLAQTTQTGILNSTDQITAESSQVTQNKQFITEQVRMSLNYMSQSNSSTKNTSISLFENITPPEGEFNQDQKDKNQVYNYPNPNMVDSSAYKINEKRDTKNKFDMGNFKRTARQKLGIKTTKQNYRNSINAKPKLKNRLLSKRPIQKLHLEQQRQNVIAYPSRHYLRNINQRNQKQQLPVSSVSFVNKNVSPINWSRWYNKQSPGNNGEQELFAHLQEHEVSIPRMLSSDTLLFLYCEKVFVFSNANMSPCEYLSIPILSCN